MSELSSTQQRYLKAIFNLEREGRAARVRDIAERVDVHKSTATGALRRLSKAGLVEYEPYEAALLTEQGRTEARRIVARHRVIRDFLMQVLGIEESKADNAAERMQHAMEREVMGKLVCFLAYVHKHRDDEYLSNYQDFASMALSEKSCEEWIQEYVESGEQG